MLAITLLLAFFAAGATLIARKLVPQLWLLVKPWSCDVCMSWWSAWAGVLLQSFLAGDPVPLSRALVAVVAATGLSVIMLKAANRLGD